MSRKFKFSSPWLQAFMWHSQETFPAPNEQNEFFGAIASFLEFFYFDFLKL